MLAITRGGLVPAGMLAYRLGIRNILVAAVEFYDDEGRPGPEADVPPVPRTRRRVEGSTKQSITRYTTMNNTMKPGTTGTATRRLLKISLPDATVALHDPALLGEILSAIRAELRSAVEGSNTYSYQVPPGDGDSPASTQEPLPPVDVAAPLEPLEVAAHRLAAPRRVAELVSAMASQSELGPADR